MRSSVATTVIIVLFSVAVVFCKSLYDDNKHKRCTAVHGTWVTSSKVLDHHYCLIVDNGVLHEIDP